MGTLIYPREWDRKDGGILWTITKPYEVIFGKGSAGNDIHIAEGRKQWNEYWKNQFNNKNQQLAKDLEDMAKDQADIDNISKNTVKNLKQELNEEKIKGFFTDNIIIIGIGLAILFIFKK